MTDFRKTVRGLGFNAHPVPFPSNVLPAPRLRLLHRATTGTITANNTFSALTDQSGNGFNFTQGTAGNQPAYRTVYGSQCGLYDNVDDFMIAAVSWGTIFNTTVADIYMVWQPVALSGPAASPADDQCVFGDGTTKLIGGRFNNPGYYGYLNDGVNRTTTTISLGFIVNTGPLSSRFSYDGSQITARMGGNQVTAVAGAPSSTAGIPRLGRQDAGTSDPLNGYIYEVVGFSQLLTLAQINALQDYFRSEYYFNVRL